MNRVGALVRSIARVVLYGPCQVVMWMMSPTKIVLFIFCADATTHRLSLKWRALFLPQTFEQNLHGGLKMNKKYHIFHHILINPKSFKRCKMRPFRVISSHCVVQKNASVSLLKKELLPY